LHATYSECTLVGSMKVRQNNALFHQLEASALA
jgi:hypothetical protein